MLRRSAALGRLSIRRRKCVVDARRARRSARAPTQVPFRARTRVWRHAPAGHVPERGSAARCAHAGIAPIRARAPGEAPHMTRILELIVSLVIVFVLAVLVGVILPSHGHIERSVEVSSPLRQVFDSVDGFRRFAEWGAPHKLDPQTKTTLEGPEMGPGATVKWSSAVPQVGDGSLTIKTADQDSKVVMDLANAWAGENKTYTVTLVPAQNGKTVTINWAYDADYGWNLMWRYAGL